MADESGYLPRRAAAITGGRRLFPTAAGGNGNGNGSGHAEAGFSSHLRTEARRPTIRSLRSEPTGTSVEPGAPR